MTPGSPMMEGALERARSISPIFALDQKFDANAHAGRLTAEPRQERKREAG
jgi:hypothetical protein